MYYFTYIRTYLLESRIHLFCNKCKCRIQLACIKSGFPSGKATIQARTGFSTNETAKYHLTMFGIKRKVL